MIETLDQTQYDRVRPIFQKLAHHLAVPSVLDGHTKGVVYVDNVEQPSAALCQCKQRFYLAGGPHHTGFIQGLQALFKGDIPQAYSAITLYHDDSEQWPVDSILEGLFPLHWQRNYYTLTSPEQIRQHSLPDGMALRRIDAALMAETTLGGYDELAEELQSERESVEDFLQRSFGFCAVAGSEIASMVTSEFNSGTRTELGINTMADYRRKGAASALVSAFALEAFANGFTEIGWHCWTTNMASNNTALKSGFAYISDYPTYFAYFNPVDNLAVQGDVLLWQGKYAAAVEWYDKAFALGEAKAWAYYGAARAYAALGQDERALDCLEKTVAINAQQAVGMAQVEQFERLHDLPRWKELVRKVQTQV